MKKKWDELTNDDWNRILTCGYHTESWQKRDVEDDKSFSSLSFMNLPLTKEQILKQQLKFWEIHPVVMCIVSKDFLRHQMAGLN